MIVLEVLAGAGWIYGWGWWSGHADQPVDLSAIGWPILLPLAIALHRWKWGPRSNPRYRYSDQRWWQRGLTERRASDPNNRLTGG